MKELLRVVGFHDSLGLLLRRFHLCICLGGLYMKNICILINSNQAQPAVSSIHKSEYPLCDSVLAKLTGR